MAPLNQDARREGRAAVEKSLTVAARVRRRLKAGRPAKIQNAVLSPLQAVHKLAQDAERARNLMVEEGLDPDDVRCALVYCTPQMPGLEALTGYRWLPASGETSAYLSGFEELRRTTPVLFLGVMWRQEDSEAVGKNRAVVWATQLMSSPEANKRMSDAIEHFVKGGSRALDN